MIDDTSGAGIISAIGVKAFISSDSDAKIWLFEADRSTGISGDFLLGRETGSIDESTLFLSLP